MYLYNYVLKLWHMIDVGKENFGKLLPWKFIDSWKVDFEE